VPGNANLGASGPARVILNEVTGASPSQLNGYIEIAGQRTDVVVSNLNGISINGGGFLNVNRATLTTGTPVIGGDGSLAAFRVTRGGIQVEGQGFNGTNLDQVDLIARSVAINANLWANQVDVIAGPNQVDYASLGVQVIQGEGTIPTVGIDVSNLGGMYANRIRLIGSEAGVGVRSAGTLAAQAGDFSIDGAGRVTLTGSTSATGNLAVHGAQGIDNLGTTAAGANLSATSEADIQNAGALIAGHDIAVAGQSVQSSGTLAAGIDASGNMTQAGNLSVSGKQGVAATGQNLAGSNMALTGSDVSLAVSQTSALGAIALTAQAGTLELANATLTAGEGLAANAAGLLRSDGAKVSAARIDSGAQQLSNRGGTLYAQHGAAMAIRGDADNTGGALLTDAGDLSLSVDGKLTNAAGRVTNAGVGLARVHAQRIENSNAAGTTGLGMIGGNGAVSITADQLANTHGGQLIAGTDLGLHLTQSADNAGGQIYAGQRLTINGSQVTWRNDGGTISGKSVQFAGASLSNRQGTILANEALQMGLGGDLDNTGGALQGGTTLDVSATGALTNDAGQIANTGTGKTSVKAATLVNTHSATLGGKGDVAVSADQIVNTAGGQLISDRAMEIAAGLAFNNAGGQTYGGTGLTVNGVGAALDNSGGSLASGGNTALKLASLSNEGGKVVADSDINLDTIAFTGTGTVHAGNDMTVAMQGNYVNAAANLLKAEHNLTFGTTGTFSNQGRFEAVNALTVDGDRIVNAAGAMINSAATTVNASDDIANAGRIEGDTLATNSDILNNTGTLIGGTVTTNAREIHNTGAAAIMAATDTLNVYGREQVTNTEGATLYTLGDLNIAANDARDDRGLLRNRTGLLLNDSSTIEGGSDYSVVEIAAQDVVNQRPAPVIVSDTTVTTRHELKREKYLPCLTTNADPHTSCTQAVWEGPCSRSTTGTATTATSTSIHPPNTRAATTHTRAINAPKCLATRPPPRSPNAMPVPTIPVPTWSPAAI
jgi:filamentous hemagglutinin